MKANLIILLATFFFFHFTDAQSNPTLKHQVISNPIHLNAEGLDFLGSENLIFVPENRKAPQSRMIAVQFYRFPAREQSDLPPVFYLPGGPGGLYSDRYFYQYYGGDKAKAWTFELEILNEKRDLIILNQRGNDKAPGFNLAHFTYNYKTGTAAEPLNLNQLGMQMKEAYLESLAKFTRLGVDIKGYDIIHLVDDIEAIRKYYDYSKVALVGTSFGSQWSLAYLQRYPDRVDRALLSGIEPLDHTYDDPDGIWEALTQISKYAASDEQIADALPSIGLMNAVKSILQKLEQQSVTVKLHIPAFDIHERIMIGADDFRMNLLPPFADNRREELEHWPQYITELYNGDYRLLALWALEERTGRNTEPLIGPLIDNSLGISQAREKLLDSRKSIQWIGEVNTAYKSLRTVNATDEVGDDFKNHRQHDTPILMIQGELDLSTPFANALFLNNFLEKGHLVSVLGGTHDAKRELVLNDKKVAAELIEFMNLDFNTLDFEQWSAKMPTSIELPRLNFSQIKGKSLFEKVLERY